MDDYKKCMIVDKTIIICGVMGIIADAVAIILGLQGHIELDMNYVFLLPIAIFFVIYGFKMLRRDNERYHK